MPEGRAPQLATYSWRLPTSATTAVVPTSAALSALPNSSSVRLNASISTASNASALQATPSGCRAQQRRAPQTQHT